MIAAEEQPGLDPHPWLDRLDVLGGGCVRGCAGPQRLDGSGPPRPPLQRGRLAATPRTTDDPRNSYLNEVLDRRLGIPITLALVCLEVGRRAGIPLEGVGFPGHFLLRLGNHPHVLIDPFDTGRLLTQRDCEEFLARLTNGEMRFEPRLLRTAGPRQILHRILNNLRGVYMNRGEMDRLLPVLDRMLLLDPEDPASLRERGNLHTRCGDPYTGVQDLESYLEVDPAADDQEEISGLLVEARRLTLVN